jgi:large subunit ribosomal protein L25
MLCYGPMTITIEVAKRDGKTQPGQLPGVVYGPKQESIALTVDKKAFDKMFAEAGESSIVTLTGLGSPIEALVQDVSFNPTRGGVTHVDFYAIEKGKEITVDVPLNFIGEAPAEKLGGVLTKALHEIEVTCAPANLPKEIDVDVSVLVTFEDHIRVGDLKLPTGVKVENDAEETVAVVVPVEEEVEVPVSAPDMAAIEVEKKGKTEEEAA